MTRRTVLRLELLEPRRVDRDLEKSIEVKGLRVIVKKTKMIISSENTVKFQESSNFLALYAGRV